MDLSLEEQLTAARADRDTYRNAWNRSDERIAELEPALAIVRELAESEPIISGQYCPFCMGFEMSGHRPTCLWLRARKMAGL